MEPCILPGRELSTAVTAAISPRSRIRRSGRVPHSVFALDLPSTARFALVAAHAHAVRDEAQRVNGAEVSRVGWLPVAAGRNPVVVFAGWLGVTRAEAVRAVDLLADRGLLVMSDALVWGVPGWESECSSRIRRLRAQRKAKAAPVEACPVPAEDLDFHPFERAVHDTVAIARASHAQRKAAGPRSTGTSDAAIAERDNRRAMGRT